ncbi:MAG: hypothetical protein CMI12_14970 [Oceanospirillum sp.]|nr:hypothetical protein [Oceanospirillum sp.]
MGIAACLDNGVLEICEGNKTVLMVECSVGQDEGCPYYLEYPSSQLMSLIMSVDGDDFPIGLHIWGEFEKDRMVDIKKPWGEISTLIQIAFIIDLLEWDQPFKVEPFIEDYIDNMGGRYHAALEPIFDRDAFVYVSTHAFGSETINDSLTRLDSYTISKYQETLVRMNKSLKNEVLVKYFDFPLEYQTVCIQYLVWFGELLADLGIQANVHTEQQGSKAMVIIDPENAPEVLEKIEQLFYTYLCLPYCELLPVIPQNAKDQFLLTNLQAQVNHFQTQIQLKDAALELKNATISSLQSVVHRQSEELLLLNSINEEELSFFNGAVKIGDITWGPVKISPKKLLPK